MFKKIGVVVGFFVALALYFALPLPPGEAAGWWQFIVVIIGLPVLYDQLKKIAEEARKKPEISIGLLGVGFDHLSISDVKAEAEKNLYTEVCLDLNRSRRFMLVIRNLGKAAAKFVKIHLEYKSFENSADMPRIKFHALEERKQKHFEEYTMKDYIFTGGADWVIYPVDAAPFEVMLDIPPSKKAIRVGDLIFGCTVWAEGLDNPVSEQLTVKITD